MRPCASGSKRTLTRKFARLPLLIVALYVLACVGCASFQRRLIYFPPVFTAAAVDQYAASDKLQRWKSSSGIDLGWKRLSPAQPSQGQILITHGNAGCAFQCAHYADAIQQAAPMDVFIVEYPGYADRPGAPSERTLDESAVEGFLALASDKPIYLVGESLGTGVATYLAGRFTNQVAGVALLAPYNCLTAVAQAHIRIFPVGLFLVDRFRSADHLRSYGGPIAMLVGGRDTVVPERFGRRLYESYSGPKRLWGFPEGDHGTVMLQPPEVWKQVVEFWKSHSPAPDLQ